jgi:hypothetical protein
MDLMHDYDTNDKDYRVCNKRLPSDPPIYRIRSSDFTYFEQELPALAQFVCPHCGPWPQSLLVRQGTNWVKGTMPIQYFMHVVTVRRLLIRMQAVLYS